MYLVLKKFNEKANELAKFIVAFAFGSMTLLIFLQVIFRYVVKESLSWSEELATYLFIWLTFLGASIATREKTHINVSEIIDNIRSDKIRRYFMLFANLLSMFFLAVLIRYGTHIATQILALKQISSSMPFLYIGLVYFAVPIGSILMFTNLIEINIELWNENDRMKGGHN